MNTSKEVKLVKKRLVQIPLWSMNTTKTIEKGDKHRSSDSSMVDEYAIAILVVMYAFRVQIPLWSMNTMIEKAKESQCLGSDSSMVDEYSYNPNNHYYEKMGSDSSMVDEYAIAILVVMYAFKFRFLYGR